MNLQPPRRSAPAVALAALLLAGCASLSPDGGLDRVARLAGERIGPVPPPPRTAQDADAAQARIDALLREPLTPDGAVELALRRHRGLQARYAALGVAEADFVRAARPLNPRIGFGRLRGGGETEIDRSVMFDVLGLLTLPLAGELARDGFSQAQLQAAADTVAVADEARRAYFDAVAAAELAGYHAQVREAADASAELARRMAAAGNFNRLAQLREQAFQADAVTQLERARRQAFAARERLARALGQGADAAAIRLPDRLPPLPVEPVAPQAAEQAAVDRRLDVQLARDEATATARALGLTRATRFVNVLHAGYQNSSKTGEPRSNGYEIELELPLFDFGTTRAARAEAVYRQAMHRTAQVADEARSEVREAYAAYRSAYDVARRYRDEVVPLRQRISEEQLLRYNGMFASVFELLADARDQVATVTASVQALREHWIAHTHLQTTLAGRAPAGRAEPVPAAAAATAAAGGAH